MKSLLQFFCRKVAEARIHHKASEIRNRSSDRNLVGTRSRSFELCEPSLTTAMLFGSEHYRRRDNSSREWEQCRFSLNYSPSSLPSP